MEFAPTVPDISSGASRIKNQTNQPKYLRFEAARRHQRQQEARLNVQSPLICWRLSKLCITAPVIIGQIQFSYFNPASCRTAPYIPAMSPFDPLCLWTSARWPSAISRSFIFAPDARARSKACLTSLRAKSTANKGYNYLVSCTIAKALVVDTYLVTLVIIASHHPCRVGSVWTWKHDLYVLMQILTPKPALFRQSVPLR